jgi:D-xylose transport system permease protein
MTNIDRNTSAPLDRADARLRHDESFAGAFRAFVDRVRSGDLGMLPVIVGLVVISAVFTALNPVFLAPNNLVNLLFDCATVGVIALGIVCVLMVGEIDLSVGSMSGLASALIGVLWINSGLPLVLAILVALGTGALVGVVYAILHTRLGMPSFVATLAGLLALLGMQLYLLGSTGSINLPYQSELVRFGQILIMPDWLTYALALVPGAALVLGGLGTNRRRVAAGLSPVAVRLVVAKAAILTAALLVAAWYLNLGRGLPWMFALFVALAVVLNYGLTRTKWGRSMFAVGGNREAARRAGINVKRIYMSAFVLCSTLAAAGGILAAARLAS